MVGGADRSQTQVHRAYLGSGGQMHEDGKKLVSLARTGWGIPRKQCRQLTSSLVHSRTDYACVVWHRYGRTTGLASKIQRVHNTANRFSLGVLRTHPVPFLSHDTHSPPKHARLDAKSDAAVLRILSLLDSNTAAKLVRAVFN